MRRFDYMEYPYPSRREVVFATRGMVCSTQPLASGAGMEMLKKGGNAVDAAVAAATCLPVVEPTSNGVGGDAFALVWIEKEKKLYGLNASGYSPKGLDAGSVRDLGYDDMPRRGWIPVMTPGAPMAWTELVKRFGRLSLKTVMEPSILYAEEGYPLSPITARLWSDAVDLFSAFSAPCFKPWFQTFAPRGRAPQAGEMWRSPELARTLSLIAESEAGEFYHGILAEKLDAFSRQTGGYLRRSDLEDYQCQWVEPIKINYRGIDVWEIPPNGDGIIALMALNILKGFSFEGRDAALTVHRQLEAMKLAFADGEQYVADRSHMRVTEEALLSGQYAKARRDLIAEEAGEPGPGNPESGGTVYLCTADGDGNMVSYIQSNYNGFGSGIVVPGTGIALQNRGAGFTLDETRANCLKPGKRAFHTIIPGFLTRDGEALGPFGVMGAFMQPQGHVQVVMNLVDFHLNPQAALDAPRWQWIRGKEILLEPGFPKELAQALKDRGHLAEYARDTVSFGRGQIILKNQDKVLCGATEPRAGGSVAAW